jgi:hypothetical protein
VETDWNGGEARLDDIIKQFGQVSLFQNPAGFETSSWKKRPNARFFLINLRLLFQKLKFWNSLRF